jgi:phenylalanyl-tRNA synthetase beta chain
MRLSVEWIKEFAPIKADAEEMARTLTMAGLEVEETFESEIGTALNITVTPNRGDCLSVIGVAREFAAVYRLQSPAIPALNIVSSQDNSPNVFIEAEDICPRYAARMVKNIRQGDSPQWMQKRLLAAGMRPVNGIVDVTNYVMLEMGQPLHAFDYEKLHGGKIIVRRALEGENIRTLDGQDHTLTPGMLAICDEDHPVAIAGIMGGEETEISASTRTILLESAHFDPVSIRRTSRKLNLRTEASYRFERYVDPEGVVNAANRACQLILEIGLGDPADSITDVYPGQQKKRSIALRSDRIQKMLGFDVSDEIVAQTLHSLGIEVVSADRGTFHCDIPSWRPDIQREIDLIEEIGRVVGYEWIPEKLPFGATTQGEDTPESLFTSRIREALSNNGLQEIISHSLLADGPFENPNTANERILIRSALSAELSGLRRSLLPGLVESAERNARRSQEPLAFFEAGRVFHSKDGEYIESRAAAGLMAGPVRPSSWTKDDRPILADYYYAKGIVENLTALLRIPSPSFVSCDDPRLHPGRSARIMLDDEPVGIIGEMHPGLSNGLFIHNRVIIFEMDVDKMQAFAGKSASYLPISVYPAVVRDVAPRLPLAIPYQQIKDTVMSVPLSILEKADVTDVFTGVQAGAGLKSITLSLHFRSPERTLTEEEVNTALEMIRSALEQKCDASFLG